MSGISRLLSFITSLSKKLRGLKQESPVKGSPPKISIGHERSDASIPSVPIQPTPLVREHPYFIQIGLDFGTSFSKCIIRDVMTDKAEVYVPVGVEDRDFPFLIPSVLSLANGVISHIDDPTIQYIDYGLYYLKQALVEVALRQWSHPLLAVYGAHRGSANEKEFVEFVEDCAIYYLAGLLGDIRKRIKKQLKDFGAHQSDYLAVNLAIPVKDAQQPEISDLYLRILSQSWILSDQLSGHPPVHLDDLANLRKGASPQGISEACFVYPEVSANVQGFVRSRVSSDGIYLFSDVGAETVDQSVFILSRSGGSEHLTYLRGSVLHLGSSYIERLAADYSGNSDAQTLENWRKCKEAGESAPELAQAKSWIHKELSQCSTSTLANAKKKLYRKDQLSEIRLIFGGGGYSRNPYETAVLDPFSGNLFKHEVKPDIIGLPLPRDLEISGAETRWMKRLYVAYGLSFEKSMLAGFTYPKDVNIPEPQDIWFPWKKVSHAPDKDEC